MSEHQIDVYQDVKSEWRWRIKTQNGSILADSGEGYHNKADCLHGLYGIFFGAYDDTFLVYYAQWQEIKEAELPNLGGTPMAKLAFDDDIDNSPIQPEFEFDEVKDGPGQSEG